MLPKASKLSMRTSVCSLRMPSAPPQRGRWGSCGIPREVGDSRKAPSPAVSRPNFRSFPSSEICRLPLLPRSWGALGTPMVGTLAVWT
uniref:Uncharacterized protein n=1 Tax=Nomascus leucogenys TaxID=61853 RepID=A0A2I3HQ13_NOMLE